MHTATTIDSGSLRPSLDTQRRIVIIGAGAAGISAAHYLKQKGYRKITLFDRRWLDRDTVVFYLLSHQVQNMEQVVAGLRRDLAKIGATIRKIYDRDHWRYFPHVAPTEIANGYYCPVNPEMPQLACPFSRLLRYAFRHITTLCI